MQEKMNEMTDELRNLYQEMILDHHKNPRNFKTIEGAEKCDGFNPLCGDHITLYMKLDDETIADIGFQGSGCAISRASASIMTTLVKSVGRVEARKLFEKFHAMITRAPGEPFDAAQAGKLAIFAQVCEYPSRVKCASLAWHTMKSILDGTHDVVTTE